MNYQPQVFRPTIRVNESTLRLAENLAAQHCVTIAELMEMLLLEFTDRSVPSPPPAQRRVVYLDPRRHRHQRDDPRQLTASGGCASASIRVISRCTGTQATRPD